MAFVGITARPSQNGILFEADSDSSRDEDYSDNENNYIERSSYEHDNNVEEFEEESNSGAEKIYNHYLESEIDPNCEELAHSSQFLKSTTKYDDDEDSISSVSSLEGKSKQIMLDSNYISYLHGDEQINTYDHLMNIVMPSDVSFSTLSEERRFDSRLRSEQARTHEAAAWIHSMKMKFSSDLSKKLELREKAKEYNAKRHKILMRQIEKKKLLMSLEAENSNGKSYNCEIKQSGTVKSASTSPSNSARQSPLGSKKSSPNLKISSGGDSGSSRRSRVSSPSEFSRLSLGRSTASAFTAHNSTESSKYSNSMLCSQVPRLSSLNLTSDTIHFQERRPTSKSPSKRKEPKGVSGMFAEVDIEVELRMLDTLKIIKKRSAPAL